MNIMTQTMMAQRVSAGTCMICHDDDGAFWYTITDPLISTERSLVCAHCSPMFLRALESLRERWPHLLLNTKSAA